MTDRPQFFGRRHGHALRKNRRGLVETLLPRVSIVLSEDGSPLDPRTLFPGPFFDFWLEIGFGSGEHLAHQAARHSGVGFIGCEPFVNGVAALLATMEAERLENIRIFGDDARLLLPRLPEAILGRVFILFADPWPKKRHHKRRLISAPVLDELARVMRKGAELRFASDDPDYVRWTRDAVGGHPAFRGIGGPDGRPSDAVTTRYEAKAIAAGRASTYLVFRRAGAGDGS